jgi:nitrate reductase alpha subunit
MDWARDDGELIPGKTTSNYKIVERDYKNLYNQFISFGPLARKDGISGHGNKLDISDVYDELLENPSDPSPDPKHMRTTEWGGNRYPSVEDALDAANLILTLAPEANGELAFRAFKAKEERTGLKLTDMAENERSVRMTFEDIKRQPGRTLTTPFWSGIVNKGRAYAGYTMNVDKLVPWRTLTGRQSLYLDHPYYIDFGEHLPTYKSKLDAMKSDDITQSKELPDSLVLNYLTPHGKWHIHSTYYDNHRMLTLSRGMEPCWVNHKDAEKIGLKDNDWVEVINDNGVMVTRAVVSARIQPGSCIIYHSPERTISMPKSQLRGQRRGGGHNSVTRIKLNPLLLAGGYAQFSYGFNYWGPVGVNRDTYVVVKKLSKLEW